MSSPTSPYKEVGLHSRADVEARAESRRARKIPAAIDTAKKARSQTNGHDFGAASMRRTKILRGLDRPAYCRTATEACRRCGGARFAVEFKRCPGRKKRGR